MANTPGADKIGGETDAHAMSTAVEQEPSNVSGDISKTDSGVKEGFAGRKQADIRVSEILHLKIRWCGRYKC